ncbi:hypothetical protein CP532_1336 [Ophiocordyceps camponoti-leonardi (nom. inval.)]|nr:hypothetical protein CP532_1336 [Ophiocordyceps camponoti-leonardi (nom. inval.)]
MFRRSVDNLLTTASACVEQDRSQETRSGRVLNCIYNRLDVEFLPVLSDLLDTLRKWQGYYQNMDLHQAYQRYGRPSLGEYDPWKLIRQNWETGNVLCYYKSHPRHWDHLEPRNAGLLNFFFRDPLLRRWPILKVMARWEHRGDVVCSSTDPKDRQRQTQVISLVAESLLDRPELSDKRAEGLPTDVYTTDPFLQAVFTGWRAGEYHCPVDGGCGVVRGSKVAATLYFPPTSFHYIHFLYLMMNNAPVEKRLFGEGGRAGRQGEEQHDETRPHFLK